MKRLHLLQANALHIPLADKSVHCIVTSPPYFRQRDYSVGGQLGSEESVAEFVENSLAWGREAWRVLRNDGTLWLNLGDKYNGSGGSAKPYHNVALGTIQHPDKEGALKEFSKGIPGANDSTFKRKDLFGTPWRVAMAFQEAGWYLRADIIWHKTNGMPGGYDRPTTAHEYIFLLTKKPKYFYDGEAIKEPHTEDTKRRAIRGSNTTRRSQTELGQSIDNPRAHLGYANMEEKIAAGITPISATGRNKRSVWSMPVGNYGGAHFACVDEETEALTKRGWLKYGDINSSDILAGYRMTSEKVEWQPIKAVHAYNVQNQDMIAIGNRDLDIMVTPNHRCVVFRRKVKGPRISRADELRQDAKILVSSEWEADSKAKPQNFLLRERQAGKRLK